jgi:hypothetical protein
MKRQPVESSVLAKVGYDDTQRLLEVEFVGGRIYHYFNVPRIRHHDLMIAPSKGRYFNGYIRNAYRFEELRGTAS